MDQTLSTVLASYPAVARPSAEPEPLGNAGGLSGSRLWRYPSGLGVLLLRSWPVDGPTSTVLDQIHRWLAEAADLEMVPVPIRRLDNRTLAAHAGHFWELTPWMPGTALSIEKRTQTFLRAASVALASFHLRLAAHETLGPSPGVWVRLAETNSWIHGGFERLGSTLIRLSPNPLSLSARRWLDTARLHGPSILDRLQRAATFSLPRQPCWRDARPEHFLFTNDIVTGLIDFGAMGVDSVAADLSRLLTEWSPNEPNLRSVALSSYSSIRPLTADEIALLDVFECSSRLLLGGHWARWHFLEGRPFTDPDAVRRGLEKGVEWVDRL